MRKELVTIAKSKGYYSFHTVNREVGNGWFIELCLLQKWIREVHEINVFIDCNAFGYYPFHENTPPPNVIKYVDRRWNIENTINYYFETYEEALEKG